MKAAIGIAILCLLLTMAVRCGASFAKGEVALGDGPPYEIVRRSEQPVLFWLFVALVYVVIFSVAASVFGEMVLPALRS